MTIGTIQEELVKLVTVILNNDSLKQAIGKSNKLFLLYNLDRAYFDDDLDDAKAAKFINKARLPLV